MEQVKKRRFIVKVKKPNPEKQLEQIELAQREYAKRQVKQNQKPQPNNYHVRRFKQDLAKGEMFLSFVFYRDSFDRFCEFCRKNQASPNTIIREYILATVERNKSYPVKIKPHYKSRKIRLNETQKIYNFYLPIVPFCKFAGICKSKKISVTKRLQKFIDKMAEGNGAK